MCVYVCVMYIFQKLYTLEIYKYTFYLNKIILRKAFIWQVVSHNSAELCKKCGAFQTRIIIFSTTFFIE